MTCGQMILWRTRKNERGINKTTLINMLGLVESKVVFLDDLEKMLEECGKDYYYDRDRNEFVKQEK